MTNNRPYYKNRVVCPFCERDGQKLANGQPKHFSISGMTAHVRAAHPGDYEDWHANKEKYVASHGCDDNGVLLKGGSGEPGTFPEPDPDDEEEYYIEEVEEEEPDPEHERKREPERKQRKPDPKPGPEPNPKSEPEHDPFWDCII